MIVGNTEESLRPSRSEWNWLAWAFGISLALHLASYGTYSLGKKLGWWNYLNWPRWMQKAAVLLAAHKEEPKKPDDNEQTPLLFIETTPIQSTADAPKDAKFYSDRNTTAANPNAEKETGTPKIDGTQTLIAKTEDTARNVPLQPSLPAPELHARPKDTTSDLAFAKPKSPDADTGKNEHSRPRTLAEARDRQPAKIIGQKMKTDGGVSRRLDFASVDAKGTLWGAYDAMFIEAVQQRWYDLLDSHDFVQGRRGRVTLEFVLNYDGRVTDMNIKDNNVGEMLGLLCQKAVLDPAPFTVWPSDMRRALGDSRRLQFSFYYE